MTLSEQFKEENIENIRIYHYVEELVYSYRTYERELLKDTDISIVEAPFLLRIRFSDNTSQNELSKLFKVSKGYTAKLLRKFEDNSWVTRKEDPDNHRKKIVKLTPEGFEKTEELLVIMDSWENNITQNLSPVEVSILKKLLFQLVKESGDN